MKEHLAQISKEIIEFFEHSDAAIAGYQYVDGKVVTLFVSQGLIDMQEKGYTRQKMMEHFNSDMYKNVHPADVDLLVQAAVEFANQSEERYEAVYREKLYGQDDYSVMHALGHHRKDANGVQYAIVEYDDISAAVNFDSGVREKFTQSLTDAFSGEDAVMAVDKETHSVVLCSPQFKEIWGLASNDTGRVFEDYMFIDASRPLFDIEKLPDQGEHIVSSPFSGEEVVVSARNVSLHNKPVIMLRAEQQGSKFYDDLTGLPNMIYYRNRAPKLGKKFRQKGLVPQVYFFDIAGMKTFNSQYGFEAGDQLLLNFAKELQRLIPGEMICRLADDHFIVFMGEEITDDQLLDLKKATIEYSGGSTRGFHVGCYAMTDEDDSYTAALDRAKRACDAIHGSVEQMINYYDQQTREEYRTRDHIIRSLDQALEEGWIKVYYQPVVRTLTGTFCGMEGLARWDDPEHGIIKPGAFIQTLEEIHQIHKLDTYIVREICKEMRKAFDLGEPTVPVSFNLSRLDFLACDIVSVVEDILAEYNIPHHMLHVEITESMLVADEYIHEQIDRFRADGFEVWLDDFGSGYSSMNVLKDYQVDEIKIDMDFLNNFNDKSKTIIRSIVKMAKRLGVHTLAEGVETKEQYNYLQSIGCEKVQGYLYGKPKPLLETVAHMKSLNIHTETREQEADFDRAGQIRDKQKKQMEDRNVTFHLLEHMPGGVIVYMADARAKIVYANSQMLDLFECESMSEFMNYTGNTFRHIVAEEDREKVAEYIRTRKIDILNHTDSLDYHIKTSKGNLRHVVDYARKVNDPVFGEVYIVVINSDEEVVERKAVPMTDEGEYEKVIEALRTETYANQSMIHALAQDYLTIFKVDFTNGRMVPEKIFPGTEKDIMPYVESGDYALMHDKFVEYCVHPDDQEQFYQMTDIHYMLKVLEEMGSYQLVYRSNHDLYTRVKIVGIRDEQGQVTSGILGFEDCHAETQRYNKLFKESETDELTGLRNRYALRDDFMTYYGSHMLVLFADLDDFKHVNDNYGHSMGDKALQTFADYLKRRFPEANIYRYGGDEFLVLCKCDPDRFDGFKDSLHEGVKLDVVDDEGQHADVYTSGGYIFGQCQDADSLRHMINEADKLLYVCKKDGKHKVYGQTWE